MGAPSARTLEGNLSKLSREFHSSAAHLSAEGIIALQPVVSRGHSALSESRVQRGGHPAQVAGEGDHERPSRIARSFFSRA